MMESEPREDKGMSETIRTQGAEMLRKLKERRQKLKEKGESTEIVDKIIRDTEERLKKLS